MEIMENEIECRLENLGPIETERFISAIIRERFDYTEWRKLCFGDTSVEDLNEAAAVYSRNQPFRPKKPQIPLE